MIYFMQAVDGGPVKIGFTDDLPTRHYHLERHYRRSLVILATMDGGRERETEIHAQFAHLRFGRTEQFRPAPDLMEFIGRPLLVGANPEAVEVMPVRLHGRANTLVRLDDDLCEKARKLASLRGVHMSEMFRAVLAPWVDREYEKEVLKEAKRLKGEQP